MARDVEVDRRLQNWARWKLGPRLGSLGYASVQLDRVSASSVPDGPRIPVTDCEAEQMDRLVKGLGEPLRSTVYLYYIGAQSARKKAERLGIGEAALHQRIERACAQLRRVLADEKLAADAERGRVERVIDQARPVCALPGPTGRARRVRAVAA